MLRKGKVKLTHMLVHRIARYPHHTVCISPAPHQVGEHPVAGPGQRCFQVVIWPHIRHGSIFRVLSLALLTSRSVRGWVRITMSEAMRWVHRLWLELHLQLFATLPEGLYGVLESYTVLRISVYTSASGRTHSDRKSNIPRHALNELSYHVLNALVFLEALQKWLLCQRICDVSPCVLIGPHQSTERCDNVFQAGKVYLSTHIGDECETDRRTKVGHNLLRRDMVRAMCIACELEDVFPQLGGGALWQYFRGLDRFNREAKHSRQIPGRLLCHDARVGVDEVLNELNAANGDFRIVPWVLKCLHDAEIVLKQTLCLLLKALGLFVLMR